MTKAGQAAHGIPAQDLDKQILKEIADLKRQNRELRAMTTKAINLATASGISPTHIIGDIENLTFTGTWIDHDIGSVTPPVGFTGVIYVTWASAGATFTSDGSISIQPYARDSLGNRFNGQSIANGVGSAAPCSVTSTFAQVGAGESPSNPLTMGASVAIAGSIASGSGNVHLSSLLLFTH